MIKEMDTVSALLDSTVRIISRDGLDKASVRAISADCNIPNPYIYQHFKDKEEMFARAFAREDLALMHVIKKIVAMLHDSVLASENKCRVLWFRIWTYFMEHQDEIQFYVRYRYSTYYEKNSQETHQKMYGPLVQKMQHCFLEGANTEVLLQHALDTMMNMAMKVYCGELLDSEESRSDLFTLTLGAVQPYIKTKA